MVVEARLHGDAERIVGAHQRHKALDLARRLPALVVAAQHIAASVAHGVHGRRRAGTGESFWQFRPFVTGESTAGIDWRRSARDDRTYIREREWEAAQTIWLWIDRSPSMAFAAGGGATLAQDAKPATMSLAIAASRRSARPVPAGTLIGRTVLQPTENKPVPGYVTRIVCSSDGSVQIVMAYGGLFGFGARPIAVPLDAMALLGSDLELLDFTPDQLSGFPDFTGAGTAPVASGDTVRAVLAHPSP